MANEEAIEILERLSDCRDKCDYHCCLYDRREEWCEKDIALDMAIKALEQTELNPSYNGVKTELKPCEDAISRDKVIMLIDEAAEKYPYKVIGLPDTYSNYNQGWADACDWLYANIESDNLPSVTPKYTDDEIQKMQELEQAQLEKAYELGKVEMQPCEDCISKEEVLDVINFEDEWLFDANSHNADTKIAFSTIKSKISEMPSVTPKASEQQPSREWKEIYAESEGSNSWIEFKCPHCGYSFGMESGEYDWHYGDEIPWKYCPICGGSAEHKPYKAESEE